MESESRPLLVRSSKEAWPGEMRRPRAFRAWHIGPLKAPRLSAILSGAPSLYTA